MCCRKLYVNANFPIAVVEAKPKSDPVGTGMQQARDYAEILGLKFAYATNGHEILEFDYTTGEETLLSSYPSPEELFARLQGSAKISNEDVDTLLAPYHHVSGFSPRYYQQIAINRVVQSVLQGKRRILITMATGTGKTVTAFQICWKLWNSRWNRDNSYRKPRILFLADRNVLIDDGFLAPYRVHRVITAVDAAGWRPSKGELDRYGREIPDGEYQTKDFERVIALRSRTVTIAKHLTDYMRRTDRFAKTMVFCVNQEHADEMRRALNNLNADLVQKHPNYVVRVTSEEGKIGKGHLSRFQELETTTPVILTTSKLLTTGIDAPTCKNVVLARVVNSMTEFK